MKFVQEEDTEDTGFRLEDILTPQLALQLQESRAREEAAKVQKEEAKKRAREVAIAVPLSVPTRDVTHSKKKTVCKRLFSSLLSSLARVSLCRCVSISLFIPRTTPIPRLVLVFLV
ncbi:unnamed protein product [Mortierella alpina]